MYWWLLPVGVLAVAVLAAGYFLGTRGCLGQWCWQKATTSISIDDGGVVPSGIGPAYPKPAYVLPNNEGVYPGELRVGEGVAVLIATLEEMNIDGGKVTLTLSGSRPDDSVWQFVGTYHIDDKGMLTLITQRTRDMYPVSDDMDFEKLPPEALMDRLAAKVNQAVRVMFEAVPLVEGDARVVDQDIDCNQQLVDYIQQKSINRLACLPFIGSVSIYEN